METLLQYELPVLIEYDNEEELFLAECPVLPGCYTDGETYEKARTNIRDAIKLMVEARLAVADPIPAFDIM
jgi:predicted RNase H-like HicB family nuclease